MHRRVGGVAVLVRALRTLPPGIGDGALFAAVHTSSAKNALRVLHPLLRHHPLHRETHGAAAGAGVTVNTLVCSRGQSQGWPPEPVAQLAAHNHEGGHPAEMVTKGAFAEQERRQDDEPDQHAKVDDGALDIADGEPVGGLVEKVDRVVATRPNGQDNDGAEPRHPDDPFDEIPLGDPLWPGQKDGLLAAGRGTQPPAITPPQQQRTHQQQQKNDPAPVDDARGTCFENQDWGEVVEGRREQKKGPQEDAFADLLTRFHGVCSIFGAIAAANPLEG